MKRNSRTTARPFRPDSLNWIDFLVIAAIALTFIAMASTTIARAKADHVGGPPTFAAEGGHAADDPGLIKAKIRLAIGKPWG